MPAQWHVCHKCKERRADTRLYLQNAKTVRYCVKCSYDFSDIVPKIQQRIPERFR